MVVKDQKKDLQHNFYLISTQCTIEAFKLIDFVLASCQSFKKTFHLASLTKSVQAKAPPLMYMMIFCKINNNDENTTPNVD